MKIGENFFTKITIFLFILAIFIVISGNISEALFAALVYTVAVIIPTTHFFRKKWIQVLTFLILVIAAAVFEGVRGFYDEIGLYRFFIVPLVTIPSFFMLRVHLRLIVPVLFIFSLVILVPSIYKIHNENSWEYLKAQILCEYNDYNDVDNFIRIKEKRAYRQKPGWIDIPLTRFLACKSNLEREEYLNQLDLTNSEVKIINNYLSRDGYGSSLTLEKSCSTYGNRVELSSQAYSALVNTGIFESYIGLPKEDSFRKKCEIIEDFMPNLFDNNHHVNWWRLAIADFKVQIFDTIRMLLGKWFALKLIDY